MSYAANRVRTALLAEDAAARARLLADMLANAERELDVAEAQGAFLVREVKRLELAVERERERRRVWEAFALLLAALPMPLFLAVAPWRAVAYAGLLGALVLWRMRRAEQEDRETDMGSERP